MLDALLFTKTPQFAKSLYPECIWDIAAPLPTLYLTFDDGPQPEITPFVLDTLAKYNARATFFCVGKNIEKHPEFFQRILRERHSAGNHTFDHVNGWKTENTLYYQNIEHCDKTLAEQAPGMSRHLFRPPYGKLTPTQYRNLKSKYRIVMWDVLSCDFDLSRTPEKVLQNVLKHAASGSIVVMHDSLNAKPKVEYALPQILEHFSAKGFRFDAL
ncbi:MAG: polysaccharide deacetylase family protein [Bacteroidetes bacterium]|nr:polysaccharide deacetylase family protein [Bacteroidota bacterium]